MVLFASPSVYSCMLVLLSRYYLLTFFFFIPVEAHLNTYEKKKKCYNANFENAARRSYVDPLSDFDLVFFFLFSFFFFLVHAPR